MPAPRQMTPDRVIADPQNGRDALAGGHQVVFRDTEPGAAGGVQRCRQQRLHGKGFLRCNKCYLVNQKHIQTVTGSDVVLSNGEKLQISRLRKKEFMEELARSMGNEFVL